jgi:hypothetical protein
MCCRLRVGGRAFVLVIDATRSRADADVEELDQLIISAIATAIGMVRE